MEDIKQYFELQKIQASLAREGVLGETFYFKLLNKGYTTFEQVNNDIRNGQFDVSLLERGFYCNAVIRQMLLDSSKGTKLENDAKRFQKTRELELEVAAKLSQGEEGVGYSVEEQNADRKKGMGESEIERKRMIRLYLHGIISKQTPA